MKPAAYYRNYLRLIETAAKDPDLDIGVITALCARALNGQPVPTAAVIRDEERAETARAKRLERQKQGAEERAKAKAKPTGSGRTKIEF